MLSASPDGNSTSSVCHSSSGHMHVIHVIKNHNNTRLSWTDEPSGHSVASEVFRFLQQSLMSRLTG